MKNGFSSLIGLAKKTSSQVLTRPEKHLRKLGLDLSKLTKSIERRRRNYFRNIGWENVQKYSSPGENLRELDPELSVPGG